MKNLQTLLLKRSIHPVSAAIAVVCVFLAFGLGFAAFRLDPKLVVGALLGIGLAVVIIRNPWHGLYLMAFFIPFERLGAVDIAGTTVRPSQVTVLLMFISIFLYYARQHQWPFPKNPVLPLIALFAAFSTVSLINAPNLERSILVLAFIVFTMSIAFVVPIILRTPAHLRMMLLFLFASLGFVTLFGLYQFAGDWVGLPTSLTGLRELYTKDVLGFPRVQSTALEPLYFANYLLVPLSILLSLFISQNKTISQKLVVVLFGLGVINLVLTVARGGYIAFAFSTTLLLLYYFFRLELLRPRTIAYAATSIIIAFIAFTQVANVGDVLEEFSSHVTNLFGGASYEERVAMFEIAERSWIEHPWLGIGPGSFGPYESWHPYVVPEHGWRIVNNEYLELLTEHGILGLGTIIALLIILLLRSFKALNKAKDPFIHAVLAGALAGFMGILVQYNTFSILYIVHIWFAIGLLIALQNMILAPRS